MGVLVLAVALLWVACGNDGDGEAATDEPTETVTSDQTAGPVTIEHQGGRTDVPSEPERILAIDENAAFVLLDVGVRPEVVYGSFFTESAAAIATDLGIEVVPHDLNEPAIEATASRELDVLVGTDHPATVGTYELWSQIAPTVLFPYIGAWQDQLSLVASAFGAEDVAAQRIASLDAEIARVADRIATELDAPPTVSVLGSLQGTLFAMPADGVLAELLESVGVERPAAQQVEVGREFPFILFSPELLPDHDADYVLTMGGGIYEDITTLELFPSLVGDKSVVVGESWTASHPFAVWWMLKDLEQVLLDGGEPATVDDALVRWSEYQSLGRS